MTHTIKESLAGTNKKYDVDGSNEGLRIRKLSPKKLRIHIEKSAPAISSRDRQTGYDTPYWAVDVNTQGLLDSVNRVTGGQVVATSQKAQATPSAPVQVGAIEEVMAKLTLREEGLTQKKAELKEAIKQIDVVAEELKSVAAARRKVAKAIEVFQEAKGLLS